MDLKLKRKKVMEQYFSIPGLIIATLIGIFGSFIVYLSGLFSVENFTMLYDCIYKYGLMIMFGIFFFIVSIYCWILFFINIILPPKKQILFLYKKAYNSAFFIDKKGKKYDCYLDNIDVEENNYYYVWKTRNYIYEIEEKTSDNWVAKEKKSYWLNFYSPIGNFEDLFLLPIVYLILLSGLLSFLMAKGYQKIYGIIFLAVPIYIIVYDFIYKIKLRQSEDNDIDESAFQRSFILFKNTISIIPACVFCVIAFRIFIKLTDPRFKLLFLPFVFAGLSMLGLGLSKIFRKEQLQKIFSKTYAIIFLLYWFGGISFLTIIVFKKAENPLMSLFLVPFWILGFMALYKYIIKKK